MCRAENTQVISIAVLNLFLCCSSTWSYWAVLRDCMGGWCGCSGHQTPHCSPLSWLRGLWLVPKHKQMFLSYPTSEPVYVVECQSLGLTPLLYKTEVFSTSSRLTWLHRNRDVDLVQVGHTQLTSSQQAQVSWNHTGKDLKAVFSEIYSESWEVLNSLY